MARKKSLPPKKSTKPSPRKAPKRARPESKPSADLPDRMAMESAMRELAGKLLGGPPASDTPLGQAQEIVGRAFEEPDSKKRAKLARQALDLSPDCADAYILLAGQAKSGKEALGLYEQAVEAGERAIGPEAFRDHAGHFWGLLETRPYMRARAGLAHTLWTLGRREEAAGHLLDMLRLNPGDNQGVRYSLASWLLDLDRGEELGRLLEQYDEDSATWAYARALLAFRLLGDTPEARKQLKAAGKVNKHVPAYLLGEAPMPMQQPPSYSPGDESEAVLYAASGLSAWRSTPGALTWLREATKGSIKKARKAQGPKVVGPSAAVKRRLGRLPRVFDTWQADCRPLLNLVESEAELVQPWIALVTSRGSGQIMAQEMALGPPTAAWFWDVLARAMSEPMMLAPHRPTGLQVLPGPIWDELQPHLEEIGVECAEVDELDQIDSLLGLLAEQMAAVETPGLLDMPGMSPEQVAGFYRAAAEFYRQAPWKRLGTEEVIRVECDRYDSGPWFALVMGQSGLTLGLALYEDLGLLRKMWAGEFSDEENARLTVALTVTFDPELHTSTADLLAVREHGWEIAGPEAYPAVFRKEKGLVMRPPLAWELELLEACLRAIPGFVSGHKRGDTRPQKITEKVATGELPLTLSWVG
jgi:tetratricopeptide (TPR) repeat protein